MAVVHRAWDRVAKRTVALKILSSRYAKADGVIELFEREFHTLKNLAHPNVVEVYDYGIASSPYYTMQLLEGTTAIGLAPLAWQQTCRLLRDVASALALIHSRRLVHRDVTCRNIHVATDGAIKLIDFGSLMPMGVPRDCVGTPAFMAPEAIQRVALDQRADLYSLGATAYHLLVGFAAYPARDIADLHEAFRTRPQKPSTLVQGIPADLDELVMSLLSLDLTARPTDASVVIAGLTAIAGLPPSPIGKAARSFLVTPSLVGRERELSRAKDALERANRGHGGCLLLRAEPGMGRSRMLDAIALEAQLAGALLLRAEARDGASIEALRAALRVDSASDRLSPPKNAEPDDAQTVEALRKVTHARCAVILVDDVHLFCLPALALLCRLATIAEGRRCLLVLTHVLPIDEALEASISLIAAAAVTLQLPPFDSQHIAELLGACFDRAPNWEVVANLCNAISAGRPGVCLSLAQHLVDTGVAVYAGGAWSLPESLAAYSLPATAGELVANRIARLDVDQRAWGQLLALLHPTVRITTAEGVRIMEARMSRARSHIALGALVAEQFVISDGSASQLTMSMRQAFVATLQPDRARELHRAIARCLEARAEENAFAAAVYHSQQAGDYEQAFRLTQCVLELSDLSAEAAQRRTIPFGEWCSSLHIALKELSRAGRPRRELYVLYVAMMSIVALSEPGSLWRCEAYFEYLKRDTGLDYWSEAEIDALLDGRPAPKWKLGARLLRAVVRHRITPSRERGEDPRSALTLLANYTVTSLGACNVTQSLQTGVPPLYRSLAPFRSLSPALELVFELLLGSAEAGRGLDAGWQRLHRVAERLQQRVAGIPEMLRVPARDLLSYADALARLAPAADPHVLEVAEQLEAAGPFNAQAEQLRMMYYLYAGDAVNADKHRRELDTLALNSARDNLHLLVGKKDLAQVQALCGDTVGLRHSIDVIERAAKRFCGWRGQLLLYRGEYALLLGDLVGARSWLEQALAFAQPGENFTWPRAAGPYIEVLIRLGQVDEAVAFAEDALGQADRVGLAAVYRRQLDIAVGLAWSVHGQHVRAAAHLDALYAAATEQNVQGVSLAVLEHARARVALASGDADAFTRACREVGRVFANHDSPTLVRRYAQLVAEGQRRGFGSPRTAYPPSNQTECALYASIDHATATVRFRRALDLLIRHCAAQSGHLLVLRHGRPDCVASVGEGMTAAEAVELARSVLGVGGAPSGEQDLDYDLDNDATQCASWTSDSGQDYFPVPLVERSGAVSGPPQAVAVLCPRESSLQALSDAFVRGLLSALRQSGDLPPPSVRAAV